MRQIDADALKEKVEAIVFGCNLMGDEYQCRLSDTIDYISDVLIEGAPTIGGWIPCSERLPELHRSEYVPHPYRAQSNLLEDYYMISEPVLVTRINPSIEPEERILVAQYEDDLDGRTYWETLDAQQLAGVVAWMPLPEPYEAS